jgi:hypothetical protein
MLPLLKKTNATNSAQMTPAWHPNFRNFERLPDTKVVRTSFFVNGACIAVLCVVAIIFGYREYGLYGMGAGIADFQRQIDKDKPASDRAVVAFKKFQEEEKKLLELRDFVVAPLRASEFLLQLGDSLPPGILLTSIDYRPTGVALRGTVSGTADQASGEAYAYVGKLQKYPGFATLVESVTLTNINRDLAAGLLVVELNLKFKAASNEAKK